MQIEINGILAELGNSNPAITKQSLDVENPSSRFIDFSNRFDLPDTQINRQIFESPKGIGTNNRSFDKLYDVFIRDVFHLFQGKGFLDKSSKETFSFQIVDDSKLIFDALNIELKKISWDDKDTVLTESAINALDAIDLTTCWFWGKACYHENALLINTDQTTGSARCKYSRPAFYVQGLLKRAVEQNGYTFIAPLPDLAFSSCHDNFFFTSYQKTLSTTYNPAGTLALSGLNTNDFAHSSLTVASTSINIGTHKTIFRLRGNITSSAPIYLVFIATDNTDPTKVTESKVLLTGTQDVDFSTSEFKSTNGFTVTINFVGTGSVVFTNCLLYTILNDKEEDLSTNPWLNYKIKAYDNLPELTYLDLFRLICVTSNQVPDVSALKKEFDFLSMANLNKMNSVDWSDKFVINSETITSDFSKLAQRNKLAYENDATVNPDLGTEYFLTDNERLATDGEYIILKFGASTDVTINSNDVAHLKVYNDTTRIPDQSLSIRLFGVATDKLQFGLVDWKYLKTQYYSTWFNSLFRVRLIDADFNISKLDFLKWHPKQLVYIDYFKTTFVVLEIKNFISGKLTGIKLLGYGR